MDKNFTLVTAASALGAVGGIAGGFALSFLVFDETGSTLASALILAIQLVPFFVLARCSSRRSWIACRANPFWLRAI